MQRCSNHFQVGRRYSEWRHLHKTLLECCCIEPRMPHETGKNKNSKNKKNTHTHGNEHQHQSPRHSSPRHSPRHSAQLTSTLTFSTTQFPPKFFQIRRQLPNTQLRRRCAGLHHVAAEVLQHQQRFSDKGQRLLCRFIKFRPAFLVRLPAPLMPGAQFFVCVNSEVVHLRVPMRAPASMWKPSGGIASASKKAGSAASSTAKRKTSAKVRGGSDGHDDTHKLDNFASRPEEEGPDPADPASRGGLQLLLVVAVPLSAAPAVAPIKLPHAASVPALQRSRAATNDAKLAAVTEISVSESESEPEVSASDMCLNETLATDSGSCRSSEPSLPPVASHYLVFPAPPPGRQTALRLDEATYMCVKCNYNQMR